MVTSDKSPPIIGHKATKVIAATLSATALIMTIVMLSAPPLAQAQGPSIQQEAQLVTECLHGLLQPSSLVAEYRVSSHDLKLFCGSPVSTGVLHIDSGHPIEGHELAFAQCASKLFHNGHDSAGAAYNLLWHWQPNLDFSVSAFYQTDGRILTIFTGNGMGNRSGGIVPSNAWGFCAQL